MNARIQDILDESLAAVLDRGESVADCLKRYPDATAELKPLLSLAAQGQQALMVTMPAPARSAARQRIMAQARAQAAPAPDRTSWSRLWPRRLVMRSLVVAGAIMLLGASTAMAASKAGPDSFLYGFKKEMESARATLAWQNLDKAAVETGYANRRLDEIAEMADSGKTEYIPGLLASYHEHIDKAQALADQARADGEDTGEVEMMIESARARHRQILGEIEDRLPEDVRQAIHEDLDEAGDTGLPNDAGENEQDDDQPPAPSAPAPGGLEDNHESDDWGDDSHPAPDSGDYGGDDSSPDGGSEPEYHAPENEPVNSSLPGSPSEEDDS